MDECPNASCWIRLAAGEVGSAEGKSLHEHLESCGDCRREYEELMATRQMLRSVRWDVPNSDLVAAVVAAAVREPPRPGWLRVSQVAAVILLSVGMGLWAGRLAAPRHAVQTASTEISTDELAQTIGLDALDSGSVLSQMFTDENSEATIGEETRS